MSAQQQSAVAHLRRWLEQLRIQMPQAYASITGCHQPTTAPGITQRSAASPVDAQALAADTQETVVVGLSGGADSLALTIAACSAGLRVHAVIIDHQLQKDSAAVAARAYQQALHLGASAEIIAVDVRGTDEAAARSARYHALGEAAAGRGVLVAHTATDDAEGVLLSLARGSGTDSLAGMHPLSIHHPVVAAGAAWLGRPLLRATRVETEEECRRARISFWQDPHNFSQDFLRSRIRQELMPHIVDILGHGVEDNLARCARLLRDDATLLRSLAEQQLNNAVSSKDDEVMAEGQEKTTQLDCAKLYEQPAALRRRIYKLWLQPHAGSLTAVHIDAIDALVMAWAGQGPVAIPWPQHCPTMNATQRMAQRLVVRRRKKQLLIDAIER